MGLRIATVENQRAMVTTVAGEQSSDIRFAFNAHALHLDMYALKDAATAATWQNFLDKVTRVKIVTGNGTPEITVASDDLHAHNVLAGGFIPYMSILTSTDNIPHALALAYPLSPFPEDPLKNFGMPAGQGIQFIQEQAANVSQDFDTFVYDLTVDGTDEPKTGGYVRMVEDAYTSGAVAEIHKTDIGPAKRILGVQNFMTTSYEDLAASAANDVTGIRLQSLAFSDSIQYSYRPLRSGAFKYQPTVASFAAAAAEISVLANDFFFSDYGIRNAGSVLGVAYQSNAKIQTVAGVAEATRVVPVALV